MEKIKIKMVFFRREVLPSMVNCDLPDEKDIFTMLSPKKISMKVPKLFCIFKFYKGLKSCFD